MTDQRESQLTIALPRLDRTTADQRGITIADFLVPIRVSERISARARHIALIVAGALFIALTANFAVPVPGSPVPLTGQTFSVLLVGGALGMRRGILATSLYLVIGFFLPVYAQQASGVSHIASVDGGTLVLGATGGYLLGFVIASGLVGRLAELGWDRNIAGAVGAMAIGNVIIYVFGLPWLMAATGMNLADTIAAGLTPFLITDLIKLAIAAGVFPLAWWVVGRRPGER
ncbi:MAG TPA: biotin transporter BioY [Candidatus Limnocylindrales bacterium]|nr:biotin transporter BioY [Candidatus Limnocylindrales bacterium]